MGKIKNVLIDIANDLGYHHNTTNEAIEVEFALFMEKVMNTPCPSCGGQLKPESYRVLSCLECESIYPKDAIFNRTKD